jgi:hypothetical protein
MLINCKGHVSSMKPGGDKGLEWDQVDQKVYAIIWFLVDPNYCGLISDVLGWALSSEPAKPGAF